MKAHFEINQGTEEWYRIRHGKIGGTISKGLFIDSETLSIELLAQKLEPFLQNEDSFISNEMQRGKDLEPIAFNFLSQYANVNFVPCGWLQSAEIPILGISPDGITLDLKIACEIKCMGSKNHTSCLVSKEIPKDYRYQCLHYFTVNHNLDSLFFCAYRPESATSFFVKKIDRDSDFDLGTKAKPNIKKVSEWVILAKEEAKKIEIEIENLFQKITGI